MDATSFLLAEHQRLRATMKALEQRDVSSPNHVFVAFATDLIIHAAIEEELVYPRLTLLPELRTKTRHAYHEHHLIDTQLDELSAADPAEQIWGDKLHVLRETLVHHLDEEEEDVFPIMTKHISATELTQLGELLEDLRSDYEVKYQERPPRSAQAAATERIALKTAED